MIETFGRCYSNWANKIKPMQTHLGKIVITFPVIKIDENLILAGQILKNHGIIYIYNFP